MTTPTEKMRSLHSQSLTQVDPATFNNMTFDVVVLGGGPAGCAVAKYAAEGGLQVALLEGRPAGLGGASVHEHLLPVRRTMLQYSEFRSVTTPCTYETITRDLMYSLTQKLQIAVIPAWGWLGNEGEVVMRSPRTSASMGILRTKNIVIATGTHSIIPPILGNLNKQFFLNPADAVTTLADDDLLPKCVMVWGYSSMAIECAFTLSAQGAYVLLATSQNTLLPDAPNTIRDLAEQALLERNICIITDVQTLTTLSESVNSAEICISTSDRDHHICIQSVVTVDTRRCATEHLGLRKHGIKPESLDGRIMVDTFLRTSAHRVFAAGSVINPAILPTTAHTMGLSLGSYLAGNALSHFTHTHESELHTLWLHQPMGWTGLTLHQAFRAGYNQAAQGLAPMAQWTGTPMRKGQLAVIADTDSGEILGAWATGPSSEPILRTIQMAMAFEATAFMMAEAGPWDPAVVTAIRNALNRKDK